jgi:hypothetical protein
MRNLIQLYLIYTISWGTLFFSRDGIFWDDWTVYNSDSSKILNAFSEYGTPWIGLLHGALIELGPGFYRLLSFILMPLTAYLFKEILRLSGKFPERVANLASIFFLVLPVYPSRHALIVFSYNLSVFLFMLASYFLFKSRDKNNLVSLILFFASFSLGSLLLFYYVIVIAFISLVSENKKLRLWGTLREFPLLLLLSPSYFALKQILYEPHGVYADYNSISFYGSILGLLMFAATLVPLVFFKKRKVIFRKEKTLFENIYFGIVISVIGLLPYFAVGHFPPYIEWRTRDEILILFGGSIFVSSLYVLVKAATPKNLSSTMLYIVLFIFISSNNFVSFNFYVDYMKQKQVMNYFTGLPLDGTPTLVLLDDKTVDLNIFKTPYAFYSLTGMLKKATGSESNFAINRMDLERFNEGGFAKYYGQNKLSYSSKDFEKPTQIILITISRNGDQLTDLVKGDFLKFDNVLSSYENFYGKNK